VVQFCSTVNVLLKIFKLLACYKIRDTLLGQNFVRRGVMKALDLAAVCEHPNAVWLANLFGGRDVGSCEEARQVFLCCKNDAKALCFAALLGGPDDEIGRAADFGDAFAQSEMAWRTIGEGAEKSASQGERDGFFVLGDCYRCGFGCKQDMERAKENYLFAAELGHVDAMVSVGGLLDKDDRQRFVWSARAASNGRSWDFLDEMRGQIQNFVSGAGCGNVVFAIGRALKGQVDNEKRTVFGNGYNFDTCIGPANEAVRFYEFQLRSCRKAVDSWTIIGLRNGVVKDMRKMIGKMIWDAREEAAYSEENHSEIRASELE
jgi:hypothetical protein